MAQSGKKTYHNAFYMGDNLARDYSSAQPARQEKPITREQIQVRRNRERSKSISLGQAVAMGVVVMIAAVICLNYLNLQSSVSSRLHNIAVLENEYEDVQEKNLALELSIDTYEDYAHIYDVATKELGMQPANEDQIVPFDLEESEYVKQYEAIPNN